MPRLSRVKYRENMPHLVNSTTSPKFANLRIERSQFAIFISFANLNGADYGSGTIVFGTQVALRWLLSF